MGSLRRERFISKALADAEYQQLQERADNLYNRLLSNDVLQHMQITNKDGEVVYRTDNIDYAGKSRMDVVVNTLATSKVVSDIGKDAQGNINTITSFPLFANGELIGSGVFIQNLQPAVDALINKQDSDNEQDENSRLIDAFIIGQDSKLQYGSNKELYTNLTGYLTVLGNRSVQYIHSKGNTYTVSVKPLVTETNNNIGQLVIARNTTSQYIANRRSQWLSYFAIAIGIIVTAAFLMFYIRHSFTPLGNLLDTVHRLHDGDVEARTEITRMDEIGRLSAASMAWLIIWLMPSLKSVLVRKNSRSN